MGDEVDASDAPPSPASLFPSTVTGQAEERGPGGATQGGVIQACGGRASHARAALEAAQTRPLYYTGAREAGARAGQSNCTVTPTKLTSFIHR